MSSDAMFDYGPPTSCEQVASKSDWYGPSSSPMTPHLPALGNDFATAPSRAAAPRPHDRLTGNEGGRLAGSSSFRGTRHIRFGEDGPAESPAGYGNSRKSLDIARAVKTWNGEEPIRNARKSIDLGHFDSFSSVDARNGVNERASESTNVGSPKPAAKKDAHSSGHDPRQV